MNSAMKTIRNIIIVSLCIGGAAACVIEEEEFDTTGLSEQELEAIAADVQEKCARAVDEAREAEGKDVTADALPYACQGCGCDLLAATVACRALAGCGAGAQASAVQGNTCSVNDCTASAGCGGPIKCIESGVECGSVAADSGVCTFN